MKTLTVFTPTYNRAHTLTRVYDSLCRQTCNDFEWLVVDDGSTDNTRELVQEFVSQNKIVITYIYKENGGLYTGYNMAYLNIRTELNVCVDSDDFMPDNAVEIIVNKWKGSGSDKYAGILGLDFYASTELPISGYFPDKMTECYFYELYIKNIHKGDSKQVLRTELMREVAPLVGYQGEKDFNPVYMIWQVCDKYPLLVINENLCFVEYQQNDSMSANIYKQYVRSARSFAKTRILEMQLKHNTFLNKIRCAIHYVSSCLIARDSDWLKKTPEKLITLCVSPLGLIWYLFIRYKTRNYRA